QKGLGDIRLAAQTRAYAGEAQELLGAHQLALESFVQAIELSRRAWDRVGEARGLFGAARAFAGLGDLDGARSHAERALQVIESLRTEVQSQELRATYLASVHQYYELNVDILMRLRHVEPRGQLAAAAFRASERARARSLLESLSEAGVDLRENI